jgi:hypothetical protein
MNVDWHHELIEQWDWHWTNQLRPRLDGLADEEYFWEPVEGCWSIRPAGDGTFTCDYAYPEPDPPPFTTIAWRLGHIGGPVFGMRANNHFGDATFDIGKVEWPGSAEDALAFVDRAYAQWKTGLEAIREDDLARACGPAEGPFSEYPFAALVLHVNREALHHGAEVALLRDLYRATAAGG